MIKRSFCCMTVGAQCPQILYIIGTIIFEGHNVIYLEGAGKGFLAFQTFPLLTGRDEFFFGFADRPFDTL